MLIMDSMFPNVTPFPLSVNVESFQCGLMAPKGTEILTAAQCRAARAGLRITGPDLAERAKITRQTLSRFENEQRMPNAATASQIRLALEAAGAEFPDLKSVVFTGSTEKKRAVPTRNREDV